jgi:glycosyltransferase involved in cell wall biosynthesis
MPSLTTVIPVYNGEPFLRATLQCLVDQERPPDRVVVIDNCSTDNTAKIVQDFSQKLPCEWRQNETNIGSAGNLNRALNLAAETDYLHVLPADDLVKPCFYKRLVGELEPIQGRALAFSYYELIDKDGRLLKAESVHSGPAGTRRIAPTEFLERQCELRSICCPSVLHKTQYQPSPAFFRVDMPQIADSVFYSEWSRACAGLVEVGEILCQNRHHPYSATSSNLRNLQATVLDEWKAISLIFAMIEEPPLRHWLRKEKLKCLFAARSEVRKQLMDKLDPTLPEEIERALRYVVSPVHRSLGKAAVVLRDLARRASGRPTKADELFGIYSGSPERPLTSR